MRTLWRLFLVFAISGLMAAGSEAGTFRFQMNKELPIDTLAPIRIVNPIGRLEIVGHDQPVVKVEAETVIRADSAREAERIAQRIQMATDTSTNGVVITTTLLPVAGRTRHIWKELFGPEPTGQLTMKVSVPSGGSVSVEQAEGTLTISQYRGAVTIRSEQSDIELTSIEGPISIRNGSGTTLGDLLFGPVSVAQPVGSVRLEWIEGNVSVTTVSASVAIAQEQGGLQVQTSTGDVLVQTQWLGSDSFVQTESGDIKLLLPEFASGRLRISTSTGRIKTETSIVQARANGRELDEELGVGGLQFQVLSGSGDVSIDLF